jgi:flagellar basal-body rod protein FlgB
MLNGIDAHLAGPLQALNLRAYRTEVLASNIANADTPNYKARDFDFAAAVSGAVGARVAALQYRVPVQPSIDGNTVEMDTELAQFSDNALRMQADLTFMSARLRELQTAIQGQ